MSESEIMDKGADPAEKKRGRPRATFEKLYRINEACELLSITRTTFYEWMRKGLFDCIVELPCGKRIPASTLNRFIEGRRIEWPSCSH